MAPRSIVLKLTRYLMLRQAWMHFMAPSKRTVVNTIMWLWLPQERCYVLSSWQTVCFRRRALLHRVHLAYSNSAPACLVIRLPCQVPVSRWSPGSVRFSSLIRGMNRKLEKEGLGMVRIKKKKHALVKNCRDLACFVNKHGLLCLYYVRQHQQVCKFVFHILQTPRLI